MIVCLLSNLQSDYFVNLHSFPAVPLSSLVLLVRVTVFFFFNLFYLFICVLFFVLYYKTFLIIFLILFFFTFSVD